MQALLHRHFWLDDDGAAAIHLDLAQLDAVLAGLNESEKESQLGPDWCHHGRCGHVAPYAHSLCVAGDTPGWLCGGLDRSPESHPRVPGPRTRPPRVSQVKVGTASILPLM